MDFHDSSWDISNVTFAASVFDISCRKNRQTHKQTHRQTEVKTNYPVIAVDVVNCLKKI